MKRMHQILLFFLCAGKFQLSMGAQGVQGRMDYKVQGFSGNNVSQGQNTVKKALLNPKTFSIGDTLIGEPYHAPENHKILLTNNSLVTPQPKSILKDSSVVTKASSNGKGVSFANNLTKAHSYTSKNYEGKEILLNNNSSNNNAKKRSPEESLAQYDNPNNTNYWTTYQGHRITQFKDPMSREVQGGDAKIANFNTVFTETQIRPFIDKQATIQKIEMQNLSAMQKDYEKSHSVSYENSIGGVIVLPRTLVKTTPNVIYTYENGVVVSKIRDVSNDTYVFEVKDTDGRGAKSVISIDHNYGLRTDTFTIQGSDGKLKEYKKYFVDREGTGEWKQSPLSWLRSVVARILGLRTDQTAVPQNASRITAFLKYLKLI